MQEMRTNNKPRGHVPAVQHEGADEQVERLHNNAQRGEVRAGQDAQDKGQQHLRHQHGLTEPYKFKR